MGLQASSGCRGQLRFDDYTLTIVPAASHTLEIEDPADHSPATLALDLLGGDPFNRAAWEAIVRWIGEQ